MPIGTGDLNFFSCASVPTDDTSTTGGAIATASRVALTQLSAAAVLALISDGADTRNATIVGLLSTGVQDSETVALTNAVEKLSTKTWSAIYSVTLSATSGTRTVTLKQGSGGTTIGTITPNETTRHIQFQASTSEASTATRNEKQFAKNGHATLSLLSAQVTLTADSASKIKIGLDTTINSTGTVTNRKTAPAGVTFVDDGVAQNVVGNNLAAGDAQGVWVQQTLGANDAAQNATFTLQLSGSTAP